MYCLWVTMNCMVLYAKGTKYVYITKLCHVALINITLTLLDRNCM